MIFNKKLNTIIWTPFGNWSTSIMKYFNALEPQTLGVQEQYQTDWQVFISNTPISSIYHVPTNRHGIMYPTMEDAPHHSYRRILILRNPYDRILSLYRKHTQHGHEDWQHDDLDWYMKNIFMFHPWSYPATRTFQGHYDIVVKVEDIHNQFKELGLADFDKKPLPHMCQTRKTFVELTDYHREVISNFHEGDFEAGGYEK